jgi:hypothetical protein
MNPSPSPAKLEDGIVAFIHGDRKSLAIDVRNAFPMIHLGKDAVLIHPDGSFENLKRPVGSTPMAAMSQTFARFSGLDRSSATNLRRFGSAGSVI